MVGFGITPEGIFQNYILYEFALEMAWVMKSQNLKDWITSFINARYGHVDSNIINAYEIFFQTVYNYKGYSWMNGAYTYITRPRINKKPWVYIYYTQHQLKKYCIINFKFYTDLVRFQRV